MVQGLVFRFKTVRRSGSLGLRARGSEHKDEDVGMRNLHYDFRVVMPKLEQLGLDRVYRVQGVGDIASRYGHLLENRLFLRSVVRKAGLGMVYSTGRENRSEQWCLNAANARQLSHSRLSLTQLSLGVCLGLRQ